MRAADIHPYCTPECTHREVPDLGGVIVQRPAIDERDEHEQQLWELFFESGESAPGLIRRIDYLGMLGSSDALMHTWRVGGKKWRGVKGGTRVEGKTVKREIKADYRPEVWTGSGQPVGPVDFSRPTEPETGPYPAPTLTSDMPLRQPPSRPARDLLTLAQTHGWNGRITQAEGHVPHASWGTPGKSPKFSEAVRLRRGDQCAVAVRVGGSWASLWTWAPTQFFTPHKTLAAFQEALPVDNPVDRPT